MVAALSVAGSDSGGGAGIQADLKTFHALGVFGVTAVTAITCQNPARVTNIQPVAPRIVTEQLDRIFESFRIRSAKTGMLQNAGIIRAVAKRFSSCSTKLVVDPVLLASSGARLLEDRALRVLESELLPLATLVTPNVPEAETFCGRTITTVPQMRDAAQELAGRWGVPVLLKGGHLLKSKRAIDVLCDGERLREFTALRLARKAHGTGCVYSAAIAGHLALGYNLVEAIGRSKRFVTRALRDAVRLGTFHVLKI